MNRKKCIPHEKKCVWKSTELGVLAMYIYIYESKVEDIVIISSIST